MSDALAQATRLIATLDALPARSVVMDGAGEVWRKMSGGKWDCLDSDGSQPVEDASIVVWQSMEAVVTVLWSPDPEWTRTPGAATDDENGDEQKRVLITHPHDGHGPNDTCHDCLSNGDET